MMDVGHLVATNGSTLIDEKVLFRTRTVSKVSIKDLEDASCASPTIHEGTIIQEQPISRVNCTVV